jgi:hypothetical protein
MRHRLQVQVLRDKSTMRFHWVTHYQLYDPLIFDLKNAPVPNFRSHNTLPSNEKLAFICHHLSRAESGAPLRNSGGDPAARNRGDSVRSSHSGANKSGLELAASSKSNLELTARKCADPSAVKTETELTRKEVVLKPR